MNHRSTPISDGEIGLRAVKMTGTIPKSSDFNNYIRRRLTLINADATLNLRESALICVLKITGKWDSAKMTEAALESAKSGWMVGF